MKIKAVDAYYVVYDWISSYSEIRVDNEHPLSPYLGVLMQLAYANDPDYQEEEE